jgi:uncharacterized repeat protein (TIGR01451 family)
MTRPRFRSFFESLRGRWARVRPTRPSYRPQVERLESRWVPTLFFDPSGTHSLTNGGIFIAGFQDSPGSVAGLGAIPITPQGSNTTVFQSSISSFVRPNGLPGNPTGMNSTFSVLTLAKFKETATATGPNTVQFGLGAPPVFDTTQNEFYFVYRTGNPVNNLDPDTGSGFSLSDPNNHIILSAHAVSVTGQITFTLDSQGNPVIAPNMDPVEGHGPQTLTGGGAQQFALVIDTVDTNYIFDTAGGAGLPITSMSISSQTALPFSQTVALDPTEIDAGARFFDNSQASVAHGNAATGINGFSGPDILLQSAPNGAFNPATSTISGYKWNDLNGDGVWQNGEPGLNGVTIYLDLQNDGKLDSGDPFFVTHNDGTHDGAYSFPNLVPGIYVVREQLPSGFAETFPTATNPSTPPTVFSPVDGTYGFQVDVTGGSATGPFGSAVSPNFGNSTEADVNVTKVDSVGGSSITGSIGNAVPGNSFTYTITVRNAGPNTATNIAVNDTVPAGLSSFVWSGNGHTNVSGNIVDTIASLASGASVVYTVNATVLPGATAQLVNVVTVSAANDTNTNNNTATDKDNLTPQNDVGVTKVDNVGGSSITGSIGSVVPGNSFTYTITVSNSGPSTATNVAVNDSVPAGLSSFVWSGNGHTNVSGIIVDTIS